MDSNEQVAPEKISAGPCSKCGSVVAGINTCPHCGNEWVGTRVPYIRLDLHTAALAKQGSPPADTVERARDVIEQFCDRWGWIPEPSMLMDLAARISAALVEKDAEIERLTRVLSSAQAAIKSLPEDALGQDNQMGYFYRDELLADINKALGAARTSEKGTHEPTC